MSDVVGVIGVGVMGSAMSSHIVGGGHVVHGYDIEPDKVAAFAGQAAQSVAEIVKHCDVILLSLPSVSALETVTDQLVEAGPSGKVVVEMGTLPLSDKESARAKLTEAGAIVMDSPVSGTGFQAADGTLVVYCSGPDEGYQRVSPFFDLIGQKSYNLGEFGNGSRMKYIANLLVTVHTAAAAEAHGLGSAAGLDPQQVQEVISAGVGSSKMFEIRGPMMASSSYEPPSARLAIIAKDAGIIADFANETGANTPLLDNALTLFQRGMAEGIGDIDAAAVRKLL